MAQKVVKKKKKVFIDTKGVFARISRETGDKITAKSFCEEFDVSSVTITAWNKEAPSAVKILYEFMKKYSVGFDELVKKG